MQILTAFSNVNMSIFIVNCNLIGCEQYLLTDKESRCCRASFPVYCTVYTVQKIIWILLLKKLSLSQLEQMQHYMSDFWARYMYNRLGQFVSKIEKIQFVVKSFHQKKLFKFFFFLHKWHVDLHEFANFCKLPLAHTLKKI